MANYAGVADSYTEFNATFAGQIMLVRTLVGAPNIQHVWMRLPDGGTSLECRRDVLIKRRIPRRIRVLPDGLAVTREAVLWHHRLDHQHPRHFNVHQGRSRRGPSRDLARSSAPGRPHAQLPQPVRQRGPLGRELLLREWTAADLSVQHHTTARFTRDAVEAYLPKATLSGYVRHSFRAS